MAQYNTLLHQLPHLCPRHVCDRLVEKLKADRYVKRFSCWNQFTALLYAQVTGRDSLRDIETGMFAQRAKLYHLGLPVVVYHDEEHDVHYKFLTNNVVFAASTIAQMYKARWKIELFFKWIKQHL